MILVAQGKIINVKSAECVYPKLIRKNMKRKSTQMSLVNIARFLHQNINTVIMTKIVLKSRDHANSVPKLYLYSTTTIITIFVGAKQKNVKHAVIT